MLNLFLASRFRKPIPLKLRGAGKFGIKKISLG
ncbi:MAG: hypothetical protein KatS3mg027_2553 [Bacteroidia bacterium]|nr:MAG: hypothetical protein KatS3mg027_2553 [Bacteroidia bacterium]